jgi:hypothetical protein
MFLGVGVGELHSINVKVVAILSLFPVPTNRVVSVALPPLIII